MSKITDSCVSSRVVSDPVKVSALSVLWGWGGGGRGWGGGVPEQQGFLFYLLDFAAMWGSSPSVLAARHRANSRVVFLSGVHFHCDWSVCVRVCVWGDGGGDGWVGERVCFYLTKRRDIPWD